MSNDLQCLYGAKCKLQTLTEERNFRRCITCKRPYHHLCAGESNTTGTSNACSLCDKTNEKSDDICSSDDNDKENHNDNNDTCKSSNDNDKENHNDNRNNGGGGMMKTTAKKVKANKNKEIKENDVYYMRWTDIYINKNAFQAVFNKKEQTNWYTDVIIHKVPPKEESFKPFKTKKRWTVIKKSTQLSCFLCPS